MSRTQSSRARERFTTLGADEPDQLIGVAAGELLEWGWLIGALADWLADAPDSTGADAVATEFTRHFAGHPTREVAQELSYSERTVKNVLHDVVTKLNARSRSHAVAFAVREGLI